MDDLSPIFFKSLQHNFCHKHLPHRDDTVTLVDEDGEEFETKYLIEKNGLSGGWRGFSIAHDLVDGDALVFQLIEPLTFKVNLLNHRVCMAELEIDHYSTHYLLSNFNHQC